MSYNCRQMSYNFLQKRQDYNPIIFKQKVRGHTVYTFGDCPPSLQGGPEWLRHTQRAE